MLTWIVTVTAAGLLLGLASVAFERTARSHRLPTRWIWGFSMVASVLIPFAATWTFPHTSPSTIIERPTAREPIAPPRHPIAGLPSDPTISPEPSEPHSWNADALVLQIWGGLSAALFLALVLNVFLLQWRKRQWERRIVAGTPVYVSADSGPAVAGLLHPLIVVPQWLSELTQEEQSLVIAHEKSHLEAHDAQVLAIALGLLVYMPWNVALWWQLRRLRFAIEIDCDARILDRGHDLSRYGEILIAVGGRQSASLGVVAAMSASPSFLEQRIRIMLRKKTRLAWLPALALVGLGGALIATAAEVSPSAKHMTSAFEAAFDTSSLDRFVGLYRFPDDSVLSVTHEGNHISAKLSGPFVPPQSKLSAEIFPMKSTGWAPGTEFSYKQVDAQIRFNTAYSLVMRLNGEYIPANRIDEAARQHLVDLQTGKLTAPQGEAALRDLVETLQDGRPDVDPAIQMPVERLRQKGSDVLPLIVALGPLQSVRYLGRDGAGREMFEVQHEHGLMQWLLRVTPEGNIVQVGALPGIKARPKWQ